MQRATDYSNRPKVKDHNNTDNRSGKAKNSVNRIRWMMLLLPVLLAVFVAGCDSTGSGSIFGSSDDNGTSVSGDWLIPQNEIFDGGPGKDGIPSIDSPNFSSASNIGYVGDDRLVAAVHIGGHIRAYPHQVLDWHEIVNDEFGDKSAAVMHCPLTGTAMAWNRNIDGEETEFGVSGLLFRNNLIAFDRNTDSNWSQMLLCSVNGSISGTNIETFQVLETTWETWLELYPDPEVLTTETEFQRDYSGFAYGSSYLTDDSSILFPVKNSDNRRNNKARVHGIIDDESADESASTKMNNGLLSPAALLCASSNVCQATAGSGPALSLSPFAPITT